MLNATRGADVYDVTALPPRNLALNGTKNLVSDANIVTPATTAQPVMIGGGDTASEYRLPEASDRSWYHESGLPRGVAWMDDDALSPELQTRAIASEIQKTNEFLDPTNVYVLKNGTVLFGAPTPDTARDEYEATRDYEFGWVQFADSPIFEPHPASSLLPQATPAPYKLLFGDVDGNNNNNNVTNVSIGTNIISTVYGTNNINNNDHNHNHENDRDIGITNGASKYVGAQTQSMSGLVRHALREAVMLNDVSSDAYEEAYTRASYALNRAGARDPVLFAPDPSFGVPIADVWTAQPDPRVYRSARFVGFVPGSDTLEAVFQPLEGGEVRTRYDRVGSALTSIPLVEYAYLKYVQKHPAYHNTTAMLTGEADALRFLELSALFDPNFQSPALIKSDTA